MNESNHEIVYMLTQQMCIVLNPLIQTINCNYEMLAEKMGRIANLFGAPPYDLIVQQITNIELEQNHPRNNPTGTFEMILWKMVQNQGGMTRNQNFDLVVEMISKNNLGTV